MKRLGVMICALLILVGCGSGKGASDDKVLKIGVLQLVDHPSLDATLTGLKEELDTLLGSDKYEIIYKNAQGSPVDANTIAAQLVEEDVDLIYAIATIAAQAVLNATKNTEIPVVFNAVTDPVDAGLVATLEAPGGNVTGVSDAAPIDKQMALIKEVMPNAQNIGVVYNVGEANSLIQVEQTKQAASKIGLNVIESGISQASDLQLASGTLAEKVDAMYVITDNMVVSGISTLIDQTNKANVPVFAAEAGQFDKGLLASDSISYNDLGHVAGKMVKEILIDGKKPESLAVQGANETELLVSESVAKQLGIEIPNTVLERATLK
ncbi:hypothetical protein AOC36_09960 [Erysipelothrix larvae]|uniref:ABC transporter substrate-binding protein n=1 Tax=Erysipelothrix larvae TaxID=1514105 RepID=A0A0X8H1D0_9FIRM|nr:ABC transporter substrate-binding protein [Erysipelothrix larvae]AMC94285.1 hypothetical protein AOC36_09960 [Erysipelothrix larvae]